MHILHAQRISSAATSMIQRGSRWQVHSVFRRVLNLTDVGQLVSVTDVRFSGLPNGVFVSLPEGGGFECFRLQAGLQGISDGGELVFQQADLVINLSEASIVSSRKSINERLLPWNKYPSRLAAVQKIANRLAPRDGLAPLWHKTGDILSGSVSMKSVSTPILQLASIALVDLINGVQGKDDQRIKSGASALTGLGIGLTPSGDDVLTGFAAALVLWECATHNKGQFEPVFKLIREGVGRKTNLIALNYLHQAMHTEISEELFGFIRCLIALKPIDLRRAVKELFAYGATSGSELGLGAYLGIATSMDCSVDLI